MLYCLHTFPKSSCHVANMAEGYQGWNYRGTGTCRAGRIPPGPIMFPRSNRPSDIDPRLGQPIGELELITTNSASSSLLDFTS